MIRPGTIVFCTSADDQGQQEARDFCKTRGLSGENAKIVKRGARVEVEITKPCLLNVKKTLKPKS